MKSALDMAKEYAGLVRSRLGGHVRQVILFGSQARGKAHKGSDFDFVVVTDERTEPIREAITDAGVEMLDRYNTLFAAILYSEEEWGESAKFPLGWIVQQEGISL